MKNINRIFKLSFFMGLVLSFTSCDDYLDINVDPNNPTEAPISGLLVNTTLETAQNTFRLGDITSNYVQQLASPNEASTSDIMENVSHGNTWFNLYNVMTDLQDLIIKSEELGASHYTGSAQIMTALNLGMTVDAFGSVPYSEAFDFETITPAYDDDEVLYTEVIRLLNDGLFNLQEESTFLMGSDDFIYQGDVEKWIKFGNMLKARYLNHLSKTDAYDPTAILAAVEEGFESNDDDAQIIYFSERFNPWAQVAINNENLLLGGWISEHFIKALDGTTFDVFDPRLPLLVGETDDGEYIGVVNGAGRGDAAAAGARSTLTPEDFYSSPLSPLVIASYAEQKFIEAEAAFYVDNTRAYEAYLEGIRAHMRKVGVPSDEIQEYINSPGVSVGAADLELADIFRQKFIALFLHPEAWVDARRFDYQYEGFTPPVNLNPDLDGELIRRLGYPDSEISRNGRNVPDVSLTDPIFWDE
ncbi:SusD/RagB family nutrient-binding outer membrane lipoprotein [Salinimicrobium terrae]|uniref:SusD/RagB family nutrient-binding outer membrane lipoprotein n=1 Tax=Salinimicrobium terrae TaxID=470866 RepID=UPI0004912EBC|nr:SusD/RagB family nutrient-binding outer membrane lipoprotein [Salinimicrobium terrae]